jgi:hypothetical protein
MLWDKTTEKRNASDRLFGLGINVLNDTEIPKRSRGEVLHGNLDRWGTSWWCVRQRITGTGNLKFGIGD